MSTTDCRYHPDQQVEVRITDFDTPGFPQVWTPATVTEVSARQDGLYDVQVRADRGSWHPQIVGKRGGNSNLRPAVSQ